MTPTTTARLNNWATFCGNQETCDGDVIPLWTLTRDVKGHPEGSTIALATLLAAIGEDESK